MKENPYLHILTDCQQTLVSNIYSKFDGDAKIQIDTSDINDYVDVRISKRQYQLFLTFQKKSSLPSISLMEGRTFLPLIEIFCLKNRKKDIYIFQCVERSEVYAVLQKFEDYLHEKEIEVNHVQTNTVAHIAQLLDQQNLRSENEVIEGRDLSHILREMTPVSSTSVDSSDMSQKIHDVCTPQLEKKGTKVPVEEAVSVATQEEMVALFQFEWNKQDMITFFSAFMEKQYPLRTFSMKNLFLSVPTEELQRLIQCLLFARTWKYPQVEAPSEDVCSNNLLVTEHYKMPANLYMQQITGFSFSRIASVSVTLLKLILEYIEDTKLEKMQRREIGLDNYQLDSINIKK